MNPRGRSVDDDLVNLGLILIAAVGLLAVALARGRQQPRPGSLEPSNRPVAGPQASASSADQATRAWRSEPAG